VKVFAEDIRDHEIIGTRSQMEDSLVLMSGTRARVHIGVDGHDGKRAAHCAPMAAINFKELDDQKTVVARLHQLLMVNCPLSTSHGLDECETMRGLIIRRKHSKYSIGTHFLWVVTIRYSDGPEKVCQPRNPMRF
jgi:hypothetical protein